MPTITPNEPPHCLVVLHPRTDRAVVTSLIEEASDLHRQENSEEYVRWLIGHPEAPEDWLLELCERGEFLDELGHRPGPRKLLEAMASRHRYPEAILTLGKALYRDRAEPIERLRDFLAAHQDSAWLFESLAYAVPDPPEKEQALREATPPQPVKDKL